MRVEPLPTGVVITYTQQFRRCGKAGCTRCGPGTAGHGPYWYAVWFRDGTRHTRYLGRATPPGVPPDDVPAAAPALRVQTLGGFAVWRYGQRVPDAAWRVRRAGTLVQCLLSAPGQRLTRDQAIEQLWPLADRERGGRALRQALHQARRALAPPPGVVPAAPCLRTVGDVLVLAPGDTHDPTTWLDAAAFAHAATQALAGRAPAPCRQALARYPGSYLPQTTDAAWAEAVRQRLRALEHRLLLHLADLCATHGEAAEAIEHLQTLLTADPLQEAAALLLLTILTGQRRYPEAVRVYQTLAQALAADLGVAPRADLRTAYARLLAAAAAPRAAARPPADPLPAGPTNLPAALTSLVGRAGERAAVGGLLRGTADPASGPCRLLTLCGAGGVGKTRLALAVGADLLPAYPDGVWLVELAALDATAAPDAAAVARAVATTLGVPDGPAATLVPALHAFLRPRRLLLVLDNCEHLGPACAALIGPLLAQCGGLAILATGRAALDVPGERCWEVGPLGLPPPGVVDPDLLVRAEAVQLFVARARAARAGFTLSAREGATVARICRRLEGIPLAIELAAARLRTLGVEEVAARLDEGFRLLSDGSRTALPRQQTLRASLEWSEHLLADEERVLLRRLAVFAGGGVLAAIEAVGQEDGRDGPAVVTLLAQLVRHALVRLHPEDTPARYRLLEPVRQYAAERLVEAGEEPATRDRQLAWCVALAEEAHAALLGPEQAAWLARLDAEHDNLRAALTWGLRGGGDRAAGVQLAGALWRFWYRHGHFGEGRRWLEEALATGPAGSLVLQARAYTGAGTLAGRQGDAARAVACYEQTLALQRTRRDARGIAGALTNLGVAAQQQGEYRRAAALQEEALGLLRPLDDPHALATILDNLGNAWSRLGDDRRAVGYREEGLALRRALGDTNGIATSLNNMAETLVQLGERGRAEALYAESLALYRALGDRYGIAYTLVNQGEVAQQEGARERAAARYAEGLALLRELGDARGSAFALAGLAALAVQAGDLARAARDAQESVRLSRESGAADLLAGGLEQLSRVAAARGQRDRAARLGGAAAAARARCGLPEPTDQAAIRAGLGAEELRWWEAGRALSPEEAVAVALEVAGRSTE